MFKVKKISVFISICIIFFFLFTAYSMGHYLVHHDAHMKSDCHICQMVEVFHDNSAVLFTVTAIVLFGIISSSVQFLSEQVCIFSSLISEKVRLNN